MTTDRRTKRETEGLSRTPDSCFFYRRYLVLVALYLYAVTYFPRRPSDAIRSRSAVKVNEGVAYVYLFSASLVLRHSTCRFSLLRRSSIACFYESLSATSGQGNTVGSASCLLELPWRVRSLLWGVGRHRCGNGSGPRTRVTPADERREAMWF